MTAHCPNCGVALEVELRASRPASRAADETDRYQALGELVIGSLTEHGPLSATDVERTVRRRRADVRAVLKRLEREGRVMLQDPDRGRLWALRPVPDRSPPSVAAEEDVPLATPEEEERASRLFAKHEGWVA